MTHAISIDGLTKHYKGSQALAELTVQRAITLVAVDAGLTLVANAEETLHLDTVFVRLVDQKEVAA